MLTAEDFVALTLRVTDLERLVAQTPEVRAADERVRGEALAAAAAASAHARRSKPPVPTLVRVIVAARYGRDLETQTTGAVHDPITKKLIQEAAVGHSVPWAARALDDITRQSVPHLAVYLESATWAEWLASDFRLRAHLASGDVTAQACTADENATHAAIWGEARHLAHAQSGMGAAPRARDGSR